MPPHGDSGDRPLKVSLLTPQMTMRVAAIYDVHGNQPALEAVLRDIEREGIDRVVVGGDVASGPMPSKTIRYVMDLNQTAWLIRGNADRELVSAFDDRLRIAELNRNEDLWLRRDAWAAEHISREERDFLAGLSEQITLGIAELGATLFCHGSPRSDKEVITSGTPETRLAEILTDVESSVVICGHTHMQFDRRHKDKRVVNPGSVGMPYEGQPGAYWAVLGPDVELRRTEYDFVAAAEQIRHSGFPDAEQHIVDLFIEQPSREEVIPLFERTNDRE